MQKSSPHRRPKPDAPQATLLDRARASRREIALALLLTACAVGFTIGAIVSTRGP